MKLLIISDSHNNIANLKNVMGFGKKIKVGAVIHCGDWTKMDAVDVISSYKIPLYSVLGNADIDDDIKRKFKEFLEIEIDGKKIGVIHDIKKLEKKGFDIVFFGHWQKQKEMDWGGARVVNPGALENGVNFAVYDTSTDEVEFINE